MFYVRRSYRPALQLFSSLPLSLYPTTSPAPFASLSCVHRRKRMKKRFSSTHSFCFSMDRVYPAMCAFRSFVTTTDAVSAFVWVLQVASESLWFECLSANGKLLNHSFAYQCGQQNTLWRSFDCLKACSKKSLSCLPARRSVGSRQ